MAYLLQNYHTVNLNVIKVWHQGARGLYIMPLIHYPSDAFEICYHTLIWRLYMLKLFTCYTVKSSNPLIGWLYDLWKLRGKGWPTAGTPVWQATYSRPSVLAHYRQPQCQLSCGSKWNLLPNWLVFNYLSSTYMFPYTTFPGLLGPVCHVFHLK